MTRALHRLAPRSVTTAKAGRHSDGGGLYLIVDKPVDEDTPGARRWAFMYWRDRKASEIGLGRSTSVCRLPIGVVWTSLSAPAPASFMRLRPALSEISLGIGNRLGLVSELASVWTSVSESASASSPRWPGAVGTPGSATERLR